jgi:hypothetical protein
MLYNYHFDSTIVWGCRLSKEQIEWYEERYGELLRKERCKEEIRIDGSCEFHFAH